MAVDVVMPQMGESIFEGTITKWLKKPGDKVERDEPLFEISTDKVDAEIPSPSAGVLERNQGYGRADRADPNGGRRDRRRGMRRSAALPAAAPRTCEAEAPKPGTQPHLRPAPATAPAQVPAAPAACYSALHRRRREQAAGAAASQGRRAHSQLAAGAAHGQGTWHRSRAVSRHRRGRPHQQAGHRSRDRGWRAAAVRRICRARARKSGGAARDSGEPPQAPPPAVAPPPASRCARRRTARSTSLRSKPACAARADLLRRLRSAAADHHAPAHRRAHGGFQARFAARVFGRRNRHEQSRRAARQVQGRIRKAHTAPS